MKICDKCKGKSKDFKDFGILGTITFDGGKKTTLDLCQDCFAKTYKFAMGKECCIFGDEIEDGDDE